MIKFNFLILTAATFFLSLLDTYFYPGFSQKHFNISTNLILIIWLLITLVMLNFKKDTFYGWFKKLNNQLLFPFLLITYSVILFLEKSNYPNFVFTNFHINLFSYSSLIILSGFILIITFNKKSKKFYLYTLLLTVIMIIIQNNSPQLCLNLIKEDGLFEKFQFHLYLFSGIISYKNYLLLKKRKVPKLIKFFFMIVSIGLIIVAFEEISWGQRILKTDTPESYKALNAQNETTLHNLNPIQLKMHILYILIGLYGLFSNIILDIFSKKTKNKHQIYKLITVNKIHLPFFITTVFFWGIFHFVFNTFWATLLSTTQIAWWQLQEIFEFYLSAGLFLFIREKNILLKKQFLKS